MPSKGSTSDTPHSSPLQSLLASPAVWHASQGEPRTVGAADEGIRSKQICSRWLPERTRVRVRGQVLSVTLAKGLPSRMVRGTVRTSIGRRDCLASASSIKESTRTGEESPDYSSVPGRIRWEGEGQE